MFSSEPMHMVTPWFRSLTTVQKMRAGFISLDPEDLVEVQTEQPSHHQVLLLLFCPRCWLLGEACYSQVASRVLGQVVLPGSPRVYAASKFGASSSSDVQGLSVILIPSTCNYTTTTE